MRKVIASSMSFVMLATTMAVAPSSMAADIRGRLTACPKLVTFKSNQPEVIEQAGKYIGLKFSAMCGDAIAPMTGMLASFRTYTLPNGTVVEQYEIVKNGKPGVETRLFDAAAIQR
ncbi:MAG TPA: hypothetical protein VN132_00315, partial [Bdellovibrio sp.]|nr:hypothetical protein [Bdellovibrio sp.]